MCGLALNVVTTRSRSDPVSDEIQIDSGARAWSPAPQPYAVAQASSSTSDASATGAAMSAAVPCKLGFRIGGIFLGHRHLNLG